MFSCTYNGSNNVFENGAITDGAKEYNTWVYKFAIGNWNENAKYSVAEEEMDYYTSSALVED